VSSFVEAARSERTLSEADDFEERLRQAERRVFRVAYAVLGNGADAEEIAQEAFLRAHRRRASLRDPLRFTAWVSRIAFRLALNRRRTYARQRFRDTAWHDSRPGVLDGDRLAAGQLVLERVREEIEGLPEKLRAVLLLCAVEGMEVREVADLLRIPPGTVRSRLHLARKALIKRIDP
jgi:RNA polymerase sigma-70 factor (ECF subfamily)